MSKHKPLFSLAGCGYSELVAGFVVVICVVICVVVGICVVVICEGVGVIWGVVADFVICVFVIAADVVICVDVVIWGIVVVVCNIVVVGFIGRLFEQSTVSVIGQLQTVDGLCGAEVRYGHMVEVKYDMHSSLVLFLPPMEKNIHPGRYISRTNSILVIIVNNRNEGFY